MFARPTVLRASARKITLPPPRDIRVEFHRLHPPPASLPVSVTATTTAGGAPASQPGQATMRIRVE